MNATLARCKCYPLSKSGKRHSKSSTIPLCCISFDDNHENHTFKAKLFIIFHNLTRVRLCFIKLFIHNNFKDSLIIYMNMYVFNALIVPIF